MKSRGIARVRPSALAAAAGTLLVVAAAATAQVNYAWSAPMNGSWTDASKWAPSGFPGGSDTAAINVAGTYTVSIPNATGQSATTLSIGNPGATLLLPDNCTLTLNGATHTNNGLIQISQTGAPGNQTRILFGANATVSGSGTMNLRAVGNGDNDSAYMYYTNAANVLTNASGHTINGQGRVYVNLNNAGLVNANLPGGVLRLNEQPKSNSGTMRASNGGALVISAPSVTQTGSGLLEAQDTSAVVLVNTSISGGSMSTSGSGAIVNTNAQSSGIDGVTLASASLLQINDNSTLSIGAGGLVNNGSVAIQQMNAPGNQSRILAAGATTPISGTGTMTLQAIGSGDNDSAYFYYTSAANRLIFGSGQVVNGDGRIYSLLTNNGVIDANQNGKLLVLLEQAKTNAGTMRATSGGQFRLRNTEITQTGAGQIRAEGGAVVLEGSSIIGGPIAALNGGTIFNNNAQTSVIDGVSLTQGTLQLNDNSTLKARTSLVNDGTMLIQNLGGPGNVTRLIADTPGNVPITGAGTIRLQAVGNFNDSAYLYYTSFGNPAVPATFSNGAGHTISGNGRIYAGLTNNGTILADEATANRQVLQLLEQPKTNNNLIRATGGGQVWVSSCTVTQASNATIQADPGSAAVLASSTIVGGRLTSSGTGLVVNNNAQTSAVDAVTITPGTLFQINDNSGVLARTSLTNDGLLTIQTIGGPGNTTRLVADSANVPLNGSGTIRLQAVGNFNDSAYLDGSVAGNAFTNTPTHTIAGNGRIYGALVNNGQVLADEGAANRQVLQLLGQPKTNNSVIRATNTGQAWITEMTLTQSGSGQLIADTGSAVVLRSAAVVGGSMSTSGTGVVVNNNAQTSSLDGVTLAAGSLLQINDNSRLDLGPAGVTNNGTVAIQNIGGPGNATRLVAPAAATIAGTGTLRLQAVNFNNDSAYLQGAGDAMHPLTIGAGQTVSGSGRIYGNVVSQGAISPDQPFGTPTTTGIVGALGGTLTMAPSSIFNVELASTSSFDRIVGTDTISVSGTLNVAFVNGYTPVGGDTFDIITGSSITGRFTQINLPPVGVFGPLHVVYTPTAVRLVTCYANCDGSITPPALNVNDFICFQSAFAAGDPYANCDGSTIPPVLNVNDFICFQSKFAAGCN